MSIREHVNAVLQGREAIRIWRDQHPGVRLDLTDKDLSGASLSGADLHAADLSRANLSGANLSGANLQGTSLLGADLSGASLSGADLCGANMYGANMDGAITIHTKCDDFTLRSFLFTEAQVEPIIRPIELPQTYHQAGTGLLHHFGTILRQKYEDDLINVRIEQTGLSLRLVITPPEGKQYDIERTLEDYALVVAGTMRPEELLDNSHEVIALRHRLDMTELELKYSRENSQRSDEDNQRLQSRIISLEDEMREFRQILSKQLQHPQEIIELQRLLLASASDNNSVAVQQAIRTLKQVVDNTVKSEDEEPTKEALKTIGEEAPGVFRQMVDLLGKGAITGSSGRLLYDWLMHISQMTRL